MFFDKVFPVFPKRQNGTLIFDRSSHTGGSWHVLPNSDNIQLHSIPLGVACVIITAKIL